MADIYFPGCHYTLHSPQNSRKIRDWLRQKYGIRPMGCCSVHLGRVRPNDRAIYVCPTCGAFIDEYAPQAEGLSVWEILQNDDTFPWPDCRGERMTVQDCWRMRENRSLQKAVRAILHRMNVETVEPSTRRISAAFPCSNRLRPVTRNSRQCVSSKMRETNSSRCRMEKSVKG